MNILVNTTNQTIWGKLSSLKKSLDKERKTALKKRIAKNPNVTNLEYLLGAFVEMYEPHLREVLPILSKKGYALDESSGFGGKNWEFQALNGNFSTDYMSRNKLEKIGVKFREFDGFKSLIFWPKEATLKVILKKWKEVIDILPDRGVLTLPSMSSDAIKFRRKYIPEQSSLKKERLFEKLRYSTQRKIDADIKKRKIKNPKPDKVELTLGLFLEELEPQVRQATLQLNKKGYSVDICGFMDNSCDQMIEGDFQLDEKVVQKLQDLGVVVETNPSGYTRLQFSPTEANMSKITKKWKEIIALLPDKKQPASPSMTRKARNFRIVNQ